jgi:hypothetical protein
MSIPLVIRRNCVWLFVKELFEFSVFAKSEKTTPHPCEHGAEWQIHVCSNFGERFSFIDTAMNDLLLICRQAFERFSDGLSDFFTEQELLWFRFSSSGEAGVCAEEFGAD